MGCRYDEFKNVINIIDDVLKFGSVSDIAAGIMGTAGLTGDTRLLNDQTIFDDPNAPFVFRVLHKKLMFFKLGDKITELAALLIATYAEGNPGFVQIMTLEAFEKCGYPITVKKLVQLWPIAIPDKRQEKYRHMWDMQKIQKEDIQLDNLVDNPQFWRMITTKEKTFVEACRACDRGANEL